VVTNVFFTELEIRLSFVKTSEFRGGGLNPPNSPLGAPLVGYNYSNLIIMHQIENLTFVIIIIIIIIIIITNWNWVVTRWRYRQNK
jgi:hypothetical protein